MRQYRLINPLTGEIKLVAVHMARHLRKFGWKDLSPAEFVHYQSIVANYLALRAAKRIVRH